MSLCMPIPYLSCNIRTLNFEFGTPHGDQVRKGFTKFTQLHVVTSQFVMVIPCALRVQIEDGTGSSPLQGKLLNTACYSFTGHSFIVAL